MNCNIAQDLFTLTGPVFAAGSHLETSIDSSSSPSHATDSLPSPYPVLPEIRSGRLLRAGESYNCNNTLLVNHVKKIDFHKNFPNRCIYLPLRLSLSFCLS